MKLYKISQDENNDWDTYDSAVVAASTAKKAITIHPGGSHYTIGDWADSKFIKVEFLGTAKKGTKKSVICASYKA